MQLRVALSLAVFGLVLAFQNCAKNQSAPSTAAGAAAAEEIIGPASTYTKIVYDRHLEVARPDEDSPRLELDLNGGRLSIDGAACALDETRLSSLRALLAQSSVCKPAPLAPGMAACMAIGLADIELSAGSGESVQLRPLICHNGTFLCDGNDKILREILNDLALNSPCH